MQGPYQKFPMLVYHPGQDDRIVKSEEELSAVLEEGFSMTPNQMTEEGRMKAKIEWHEDEIRALKSKLADMKKNARKAA